MWNAIGSGLRCLDDLAALLRLQIEWGADEAIGAEPNNRLGGQPGSLRGSQSRALQPGIPQAGGSPGTGEPTPAPPAGGLPATFKGTPAERALSLAVQATTLADLRAALAGFDGCSLRDTASNLVFAQGNAASPIVVVGDPPGREDDRSGHPFAGQEGELLDQMLASIGLRRGELMLTPLLPWRPPGGRPPSPAEIAICQPFLHRLVALVQPRLLVLFGAAAARSVLPQAQNRRRPTPAWIEARIAGMQETLSALTLPGLAEMLKNPPLRRDAWTGLRLLRRTIDRQQT